LKKLLIYTGSVQSGKTSRLLSFIQDRKDVGGILSPLIDGKKYLYDIFSGESKLLESDSDDREEDIIVIGKYKFKKKIFRWAKEVLQKASEENYSYLIIDEIGPLEFEGNGLSPVTDEIILKYFTYSPKILLVVRESLVGKFLHHYRLKPEEIEFFKLD
jgi:nucleoside-triphosphatase THEP1